MKKTSTANIAGKLFTINDDAFEMLERYLREKSFSQTDSQEIMNFELKVAELIEQRAANRIIDLADIHYIISVLGPTQYNETGFSSHNANSQSYYGNNQRRNRKMYRDTDNRVIGGVCSGLAAYFDADTALFRILFILFLFIGFGFLAYIILWIALPKARTPEQKAEMYSNRRY